MTITAVAPGLFAALLALAILVFGRRPRLALGLAGAATAGLVALLAVRWAVAGHPPLMGTWETDLAQTLVVLALVPLVRRRAGSGYFRGPAAVAALTLLHTFAVRPEATPLTISEQSVWIDLHAPLSWLAWACYFHAALVALRRAPAGAGADPVDDAAQGLALRLLGWGFLAHTAMGFAGVYYASVLFARPWSWDPVQTLGLLSWILVAAALHFRLFFRLPLLRQRALLGAVLASYVACAKLPMWLPPGQTFHVFELGALAAEGDAP